MAKTEPDDFTIWQQHPITVKLHAALTRMADEAREHWIAQSWNNGVAYETTLIDLKATARVCTDICEMTLEELEAKIGD